MLACYRSKKAVALVARIKALVGPDISPGESLCPKTECNEAGGSDVQAYARVLLVLLLLATAGCTTHVPGEPLRSLSTNGTSDEHEPAAPGCGMHLSATNDSISPGQNTTVTATFTNCEKDFVTLYFPDGCRMTVDVAVNATDVAAPSGEWRDGRMCTEALVFIHVASGQSYSENTTWNGTVMYNGLQYEPTWAPVKSGSYAVTLRAPTVSVGETQSLHGHGSRPAVPNLWIRVHEPGHAAKGP